MIVLRMLRLEETVIIVTNEKLPGRLIKIDILQADIVVCTRHRSENREFYVCRTALLGITL